MPKTGIEPISKSYKEFVLPIKLFRLNKQNKNKQFCVCCLLKFCPERELNSHFYIFRIAL